MQPVERSKSTKSVRSLPRLAMSPSLRRRSDKQILFSGSTEQTPRSDCSRGFITNFRTYDGGEEEDALVNFLSLY